MLWGSGDTVNFQIVDENEESLEKKGIGTRIRQVAVIWANQLCSGVKCEPWRQQMERSDLKNMVVSKSAMIAHQSKASSAHLQRNNVDERLFF